MQETKVTLIYSGLSLFVFLALVPWIVDMDLALISIQVLAIFGGVVVADCLPVGRLFGRRRVVASSFNKLEQFFANVWPLQQEGCVATT